MAERGALVVALLRIDQQISQDALLRNWVQLGEPWFELSDAGVVNFAVDHHHTLFAHIGVEAAELKCQIRRRAVAKSD